MRERERERRERERERERERGERERERERERDFKTDKNKACTKSEKVNEWVVCGICRHNYGW